MVALDLDLRRPLAVSAELALVTLRAEPHEVVVDVEQQLPAFGVGGQPYLVALDAAWSDRDLGLQASECTGL